MDTPEEGVLLGNEGFFQRARVFNYNLAQILYLKPLDLMKCLCPDWMHTVDLGIGQDLLGGVFYECVAEAGVFPGNSQDTRMQGLWDCIQSFYKKNPVQSQLEGAAANFTVKKKLRPSNNEAPSLRSKAAQCRGLQPLLPILAGLLNEVHDTDHSKAVLDLCLAFNSLRQAVSVDWDLPEAKVALATFLKVYRVLQQEGAERNVWQMMPKCHLLYHLVHQTCQHQGRVQHFWNYAEESLGGRYAKMAFSRGGPSTRGRTAEKLFLGIYHLQEFYPWKCFSFTGLQEEVWNPLKEQIANSKELLRLIGWGDI